MAEVPRIYREITAKERADEERVFLEALLQIVDPLSASILIDPEELPPADDISGTPDSTE